MIRNQQPEVIEETAMTPELDAAIRELLCTCFPTDTEAFSRSRHWHGSGPAYSVIRRAGSRLDGHVGIVVRTIRAGNEDVTVAGIQNFAVRPECRGTQLGPAMMAQALTEARLRGLEFGLLFCVPALGPYYTRLGWETVDVEARMNFGGARDIPIPGKNICMAARLGSQGFPPGNLHLCGPDW